MAKNVLTPVALRLTSVEASKRFKDNSIDLIFIDADHAYESIREDIQSWLPKVKKGGIICGHDYSGQEKGVIKAVDELLGKDKIETIDNIKDKDKEISSLKNENAHLSQNIKSLLEQYYGHESLPENRENSTEKTKKEEIAKEKEVFLKEKEAFLNRNKCLECGEPLYDITNLSTDTQLLKCRFGHRNWRKNGELSLNFK
jgi:hypothetical protein